MKSLDKCFVGFEGKFLSGILQRRSLNEFQKITRIIAVTECFLVNLQNLNMQN